MSPMSNRTLARFAVGLLAAVTLLACSDGSSNTDPPEPASLTDLANQLSRIMSGVIVQDATQASADDLRESFGFIMASGGFPSETPPTAVAARESDTSYGRILDAMKPPQPVDLFEAMGVSAPPRPPLGVTCDWDDNPAKNFWKLDPDDRVGTPPSDGIRFELYTTQGEAPVLPLQPIGSFIDLRPIAQGTSVIDVIVTAGPANTEDVLFSYQLEGTSTPDLVNLFMSGVISNTAGVLDFFFTIDNVRGTAGGTVEDLMIESNIGVDFSGLVNQNVVVDKLNNVVLEYDFDFDAQTRAITRGEVTLDGELAALISGTQSAPVFNVVTELGAQARSELTSILLNTQDMSGRVTDFFLLAHCIGSDREEECARL